MWLAKNFGIKILFALLLCVALLLTPFEMAYKFIKHARLQVPLFWSILIVLFDLDEMERESEIL